MKWKKYTFTTDKDKVDILSALLADAGIEGIEVEDHKPLTEEETKGMFIDILPDIGEDDGTAKISFYLDPDDEELEKKLAAAKEVIGDAMLSESETADEDWINNWKQFFKPLTIGDILIQPSWEEVSLKERGKTLILIDPGTAFGTGGHETTQLCIMQLEKYIKELSRDKYKHIEVLDVGTGSGILGITALRIGASHVFGTDVDDNALTAVRENMQANAVMPDEFTLALGDIITNRAVQFAAGFEKYDIVVANILAPVIIELQKEVFAHAKHGAIFITSGIIDTKENDVVNAFKENPEWELIGVERLDEWVSVIAKRK